MRKTLAVLLLVGTGAIYAQSTKSKSIKVSMPSYAEISAPKDINTYMGAFANTERSVLPFTEEEFQKSLNFEDFKPHMDDSTAPDLLFALNGISIDDLNLTISRSKANETYSIDILPKSSAKMGLLTMAKGESVHYYALPIIAKVNNEGKSIPVTIDFTFEEEEKYLIFNGDDQAKGSPYLVQEFLRSNLGDEYLTKTLAPTLYGLYDIRVNQEFEKFYYIKDKKTDGLEDETKENVLSLEKVAAELNTIEKMRAGKGQIQSFIDYWESNLAKYDLSNKSGKKVGWGILMNLYNLSLMTENYDAAQKYMDRMVELEEKKWITRAAKSAFEKKMKAYASNFDLATGERKYAAAYEVDPMLIRMENENAVKENDIKNAPGHIVFEDGSKMEGKLTMYFAKKEDGSDGNIMDISGDKTAKVVYVKYVNEKGKTKTKSLKCKDVQQVVVNDAIYEPVNPKRPLLDSSDGALTGIALNNTIYMKLIYKGAKIKVYEDLTGVGQYFFQILGEKKAERVNSEYFAGCSNLAQSIENGEFTESKEDQVKIAKAYDQGCK
ncbi:hypothetical protein [Maribacter polysiphoniae]|uniref:hypothetical protein n=1 Tax=Maribacter polysiphoniae TaxID=429344 RepID=UPI002352F52B|nr:hypothetical protein [Maribacter polysiphoniae]